MVLMCNEPEEWKFSTRVWKKNVHYLQNSMEQYEAKCVSDNKALRSKCVCIISITEEYVINAVWLV